MLTVEVDDEDVLREVARRYMVEDEAHAEMAAGKSYPHSQADWLDEETAPPAVDTMAWGLVALLRSELEVPTVPGAQVTAQQWTMRSPD